MKEAGKTWNENNWLAQDRDALSESCALAGPESPDELRELSPCRYKNRRSPKLHSPRIRRRYEQISMAPQERWCVNVATADLICILWCSGDKLCAEIIADKNIPLNKNRWVK